MMRLLWIPATLFLLALGCSATDGSLLVVTVQTGPGATIQDVDHLAVNVTSGMTTEGFYIPLAVNHIPPAHSFGVQVDPSFSGDLAIEVQGITPKGTGAGTGMGTATVTAGESGDVTITLGGAPVLSMVVPALGPSAGGVMLELDGTGFATGAMVSIGGKPLTNVNVSATRITGTLPANPGAFGSVAVAVTNPGGLPASRGDLFRYYASNLVLPVLSYGAGLAPSSVAIGDLSGDGWPDLAVANNQGGNVSVLLGKGDGAFQAAQNFLAGGNPQGVAIGDVNGDGKPDLAVANYGTNNVSVLLGKGDGTFQTHQDFPTGTNSSSVAIADVNKDGKPDLVVANASFNSNNVSVLLGNGDGTFQTHQDFPTGNNPFSVAIGDVNGDGKPDLAVAYQGGISGVSVLLGKGDGTFQTAQNLAAAGSPSWVAIGDLNGDGKPDLAVANLSGKNVSVLLGNGDGTFQTHQDFPVGNRPFSLVLGDLNGDGKPDLAVANHDDSNVSVLLGNGDGTFQAAQNFPAGSQPASMAIGDVNGDGKPDLAVANGTGNVSVLLNES